LTVVVYDFLRQLMSAAATELLAISPFRAVLSSFRHFSETFFGYNVTTISVL
jgi:hypothetical protein